jgi:site-specific recombinase XerD
MTDQDSSHRTWLSQLKDHLNKERYAAGTARRVVGVAGHFLAYLDMQHVDIRWARPADVEGYLQQALETYQIRNGHLPGYVDWQTSHTSDIRILLRLVQGQWPPDPVAVTPAEILQRDICKLYTEWMTSMRGLAGATVSGRCDEACRFLDWMGERATREALTALTVPELDAYMKHRAASLRRASLKTVANNIRCFLRWLHISGQTTRDLSVAVVAPSLYALEGIPSALRSEDIEKVLAATRQDRTPKGLRDYAILMLLSKYGLRAGEVTALRLEDMDWRQDVIRIRHTKTCAVTKLPMVPEVGEGILEYLEKGRPTTTAREVFIRIHAPYRSFKNGSSLYTPVRYRIAAAGVVTAGKRGPHTFRHARAVSMLRAAVPLKDIGDMLGHRSTDSTRVYLKLASDDLRAVALEIPEEVDA